MAVLRTVAILALCILAGNASIIKSGAHRDDSMLKDMKARFYNGASISNYVDFQMDRFEQIADRSDFSMSRRTVIYVHGFTENLNEPSVRTVIGAYLSSGKNINLLAVEWTQFANGDYLTSALPNTRKVGSAVATKLKELADRGLKMSNLHLVGHSLGGHICGFIGKNLQTRFGLKPSRISALDPAGPGFYPVTSSMRLDAGDANRVEAIITDPSLYGYPFHVGHISYWPNQGNKYQPGCPEVSSSDPEAFCSHQRSWRYWAESLERENSFIGFNDGGQAVMGDNFDGSKSGEFKLKTAARSPFGLGSNGRP